MVEDGVVRVLGIDQFRYHCSAFVRVWGCCTMVTSPELMAYGLWFSV